MRYLPENPRSFEELEVGVTYLVEFQDCCVEGSFVSQLKAKDDEHDQRETAWENGVKIEGAVSYYEEPREEKSTPKNFHLGTGE